MIPKVIEDRLLVRWHRTFSHRRAEFTPEQAQMRLELQRRGLLFFDKTTISESMRKLWQ
jgi:hypothetical protein